MKVDKEEQFLQSYEYDGRRSPIERDREINYINNYKLAHGITPIDNAILQLITNRNEES